MSALEQVSQPRLTRRAAIRAVEPRPARPGWHRGVFPVIILALLALGMVGHLALQTRIQEQGFELGALQAQAEQLDAQQAILAAALDKQSTPAQLAYSASQLGMVANPYTTILDLGTGQVTGSGKPVAGNELAVISAPPQLPNTTTPVDPLAAAQQPAGPPAPAAEPTAEGQPQ